MDRGSTCKLRGHLRVPCSSSFVQIARHRSGRSAGFAIITYASMAEAQAALVADNHYLCGRRLQLRWYSATDGTSSTSRQQVLGRDLLLGQLVSPMLGSGLRMPAHQAILGGSAYPETSWLLQNDSFNDSFQVGSIPRLFPQACNHGGLQPA
jgi:RNA recognition motif-containing protein